MPYLHVEIVQKPISSASKHLIIESVRTFMSRYVSLSPGATIKASSLEENLDLKEHVECIKLCDIDYNTEIRATNVQFKYHVVKLNGVGSEIDTMTDTSTGEEFSVAQMWALPARDFHGLWESLVYDSNLKEDTVRFVETAFEFADHGVDPNIVAWNRVVLLHGPPGTGKTSFCRALAQKLAVRFDDRFPRARLIEINAHGLFSKWFAESGKLVARLFEHITEIVEDRQLLLCVLIDEVESLAHARRSALAGVEPSDSIRAVNALLTQLDRLRFYPNTLVLTTSNVTGAIDLAFIDRADIKQHIGLPSDRAAYEILRSCCEELKDRGLLLAGGALFALPLLESWSFAKSASSHDSLKLWEVAQKAAAGGASGRALRRLPLRAMARLAHRPPTLLEFVNAMQSALDASLVDAADMDKDPMVRTEAGQSIPNGH
ncbi:hypothetical protein K1T71_002990 [Dendrolimus kikuchii]|uniref:Uncharacterized protein n=1 Tax=Dendrolimus kikuchii TaxID=765133 RepID=A0ACC1DAQ1_9NEOP|nr:hypothetical protein K1T71_002990 [Dendrolimus kikuchii]